MELYSTGVRWIESHKDMSFFNIKAKEDAVLITHGSVTQE